MSSPTVLSADLKGKIQWWPQLLKFPGVRGQVPSKHWVCFNWNKRICWRLLLIDVTHKSRLEIANNCFKACLWACYRWVGLSAYYSIMPSKQEMDVKAWKTKCGHGGFIYFLSCLFYFLCLCWQASKYFIFTSGRLNVLLSKAACITWSNDRCQLFFFQHVISERLR